MRSHAGALPCLPPLQRRIVPSVPPSTPVERSSAPMSSVPEPYHGTVGHISYCGFCTRAVSALGRPGDLRGPRNHQRHVVGHRLLPTAFLDHTMRLTTPIFLPGPSLSTTT